MTNEIIKVLDYLGEKFGMAIDWTQENVLPYVQDLAGRFVKYYTIQEIVYIVVFVLMGIAGFVLGRLLISSYVKVSKTGEDRILMTHYSYGTEPTLLGGISIIVVLICFLCGFIGVPVCVSELIKWTIIPEFQIVEEISYLMQTL